MSKHDYVILTTGLPPEVLPHPQKSEGRLDELLHLGYTIANLTTCLVYSRFSGVVISGFDGRSKTRVRFLASDDSVDGDGCVYPKEDAEKHPGETYAVCFVYDPTNLTHVSLIDYYEGLTGNLDEPVAPAQVTEQSE